MCSENGIAPQYTVQATSSAVLPSTSFMSSLAPLYQILEHGIRASANRPVQGGFVANVQRVHIGGRRAVEGGIPPTLAI